MVNVANGNLLVQADDIDVPERGIDLAFRRTYNSQSAHDTVGSDGATPSLYGNGWTNTFDAHLSYNSTANVMSVYDIDGARYDYTANGSGGWTPGAGMQGTSLVFDGGGGYYWTKKSGTIYYFFTPTEPAQYAGYAGRTYQIIGRNHNNYINFVYSWAGGNSSTINNLTAIDAEHSDGQMIVETFAMFGTHLELASLTRPDNLAITYNYDTSGDLAGVTRPGKATDDATQTATITNLNEVYAYWAGTHEMQWVAGPRYEWSSDNDGSCYEFTYSANTTSGQLTWISDYGLMNPTPNDGTGTAVQSGSTAPNTLWRQVEFTYYPNYAGFSELTQMSDTQGHFSQWGFDSSNRDIETWDWQGTEYLVTYATWDGNNDLTASVDPRGDETDYAYDTNGNAIAVAQPQVTTSIGTFRPTALYSYDQFNNVTVYCDPIQTNKYGGDWVGSNPGHPYSTGDNLCGAIAGSAIYTYNYSDASEPYGYLTDTYTPLGYHTAIVYSTSAEGGDYGLPTSVTGTSFTQNNGTNAQPQQSFTYDAYGDLQTYSKGYGSYQLTYDLLHRMTSATDPDSVTSRTYYNPDSTVECKQTAYQYSLDGAACGTYSEDYTYDPDANELSETHHHGQTPTNGVATGITQKWYDGEDRLIEVQLPSDASTDNSVPWRTRYIYDLTDDTNVSFYGTNQSPSNLAHGNLYKTQNYLPVSGATALSWNDVNGNAFDALDRSVRRYQYSPGNGVEAWTSVYDTAPYQGLLASKTDPMNVTTTYAYDDLNRQQSITFSDGVTPGRSYAYDPDGRTASISSTVFGTDSYLYDADGRETQYGESSGGGVSSPATLTYGYYPNGWRQTLSISSSALNQQNEFTYDYRNDGKRTNLAVAGQAQPFAWTYTNAERELTQSDPFTGGAANGVTSNGLAYPQFAPHTEVARTGAYDSFGRLASLELPNQGTYANIGHDIEGNLTSYSAQAGDLATGQGLLVTAMQLSYDVRGEQASMVGTNSSGAASPYTTGTFLYGHSCSGLVWTMNITPLASDCAGVKDTNITTKTDVTWIAQNSVDPYTGTTLTGSSTYDSRGTTTCPGYDIWGQGAMSYDLDGRQSNESLNVSSSYSGCGVSISSVNSRAYDAEGHVTQDVCANAGTGTGVSIPACSPNSNFGGTTASLGWGPSGKLRTATNISASDPYEMTIHWDGDRPLFITDSTGALVQLSVETLGGTTYVGQAPYFFVLDRDFSGTQVSAHDSNGDDGPWEYGQLYSHVIGKGATVQSGGWVGSANAAGDSLVLAPAREDGYAVRGLMIQGVRSYDSNTEQWTTPDAYKGDVHDPMSQRSYMWNNNNPVAYSDPSGYCVTAATCPFETFAIRAASAAVGGAIAGVTGAAVSVAGLALLAGGKTADSDKEDAVPERAFGARDKIEASGEPVEGGEGGDKFQNKEGLLPEGHEYVEWDVNGKNPGQTRDAERLVEDKTTGDWYYTGDHYGSFTKMSKINPFSAQEPPAKTH